MPYDMIFISEGVSGFLGGAAGTVGVRIIYLDQIWTKSGLLTLFTHTLTGLFARYTCFPFMVYGLWFILYLVSMTYTHMT
jgi:hypothetical protein